MWWTVRPNVVPPDLTSVDVVQGAPSHRRRNEAVGNVGGAEDFARNLQLALLALGAPQQQSLVPASSEGLGGDEGSWTPAVTLDPARGGEATAGATPEGAGHAGAHGGGQNAPAEALLAAVAPGVGPAGAQEIVAAIPPQGLGNGAQVGEGKTAAPGAAWNAAVLPRNPSTAAAQDPSLPDASTASEGEPASLSQRRDGWGAAAPAATRRLARDGMTGRALGIHAPLWPGVRVVVGSKDAAAAAVRKMRFAQPGPAAWTGGGFIAHVAGQDPVGDTYGPGERATGAGAPEGWLGRFSVPPALIDNAGGEATALAQELTGESFSPEVSEAPGGPAAGSGSATGAQVQGGQAGPGQSRPLFGDESGPLSGEGSPEGAKAGSFLGAQESRGHAAGASEQGTRLHSPDGQVRHEPVGEGFDGETSSARAGAAGTAPAPSSSPSGAAGSTSTGSTPSPAEQLGREVIRMVQHTVTGGTHEATLQLEPESLGELWVRLSVEKGQVRLLVAAERESTRALLSSQLSSLREALEGHGLRLEQVRIELLRDPGTFSFGDHPFAQGESDQWSGAPSYAYRNPGDVGPRGQGVGEEEQLPEPALRRVSSGIYRVDVRV